MKLYAGILIVVIVFVVVMYVLRAARKNAILVKNRENSENYFLYQMKDFALDSTIVFNSEEDLFSQDRMINAGIEVVGESIQLADCVKNVPWFF